MSYPKPLSKKTIARMYKEARLSDKQVDFLHDFFAACANLYGAFFAQEAWEVYRTLSEEVNTVPIRRKEMFNALAIFRREELPYFIFEQDEVYSDEPREEKYRIIAINDLINKGWRKFSDLYDVLDQSVNKPFFIPDNLLEYRVMPISEHERTLLNMLGKLKSTESKYTDKFGNDRPCDYKGKRLREFSYINDFSRFELRRLQGKIEGYKGNEKQAAEYEAELNSVNAAEYLINNLKYHNNIGRITFTESIEFFFEDLTAMGVSISVNQAEKLINAINDMHNNRRLWINHGFTPNELMAMYPPSRPKAIVLGPGYQKAFAEGALDKDEVVNSIRAMGFDVIE